jgi:protocatechuate 3,4-dioxygenase beta subunit
MRWRRGVGYWVLAAWALTVVILGDIHTAPAAAVCAPTRPDAEGPFYKPNAPERESTGRGLVVSGVVRSSGDCRPIPGVRIEWWSANVRGEYDDQHRAIQRGDGEGRYRYETNLPGRYPGRPLHLHVRVAAPGHRTLITQLYPASGQTSLAVDFVLIPE